MSTPALLTNVHEGPDFLNLPEKTFLVTGDYEYYHYLCDDFDDRVSTVTFKMFLELEQLQVMFSSSKVFKRIIFLRKNTTHHYHVCRISCFLL